MYLTFPCQITVSNEVINNYQNKILKRNVKTLQAQIRDRIIKIQGTKFNDGNKNLEATSASFIIK